MTCDVCCVLCVVCCVLCVVCCVLCVVCCVLCVGVLCVVCCVYIVGEAGPVRKMFLPLVLSKVPDFVLPSMTFVTVSKEKC